MNNYLSNYPTQETNNLNLNNSKNSRKAITPENQNQTKNSNFHNSANK